VKTADAGDGFVLFSVDVRSKQSGISTNVAASLTVTYRKKDIARVDLKETAQSNGVRFSFQVSRKYLDQSKFVFKDIEGPGSPHSYDVYWFILKDFAHEK
jgi:hypothetical protein